MDFNLTSVQRDFQAEVREFAEKVLRPGAEKRWQDRYWDYDIYRQMGERHWPGLKFPVEYGGTTRSTIEYCILMEELAKVECSLPAPITFAHQTGMGILAFATEEQKQKYLPPLARGETVACSALTENMAGSKLSDMKTTAVREGDDWVINGTKTEVHIPEKAQVLTVYAKTETGISTFLVETATPGFEILGARETAGTRGLPMNAIGFRNCRVPADALLGKEGRGIDVFAKSFYFSRIGNAAKLVGAGEGALDEAIEYAKKRKIGDNVVTDFQGIRWQIVDLKTRLHGARLMAYEAACQYDSGQRSTKTSNMAKVLAGTAAMEAATTAMQITGSYGCFSIRPFARYMMDIKMLQLGGGSLEICKNTVARELLGKTTAPQP